MAAKYPDEEPVYKDPMEKITDRGEMQKMSRQDCVRPKQSCHVGSSHVNEIKRKHSRNGNCATREMSLTVPNVDHARKVQSKMTRNKKDKVKPTTVYVKFAWSLGPEVNILGYLRTRLSPGIEFSVEDRVIDKKTQNTICTLKCPGSRIASRLKYELHKGNPDSETKAWCFDNIEEALGTKIYRPQDIEAMLAHHVEQIVCRAETVLKAHDEKLNELETHLATKHNMNAKFRSIEEFQSMDVEKRALQDKVEELAKQKQEFQYFLRSVYDKLEEVKESKQFSKSAHEVRLDFAIECARLTSALPIYARRSDIIRTVNENQVCVIIGETGSGKSTQMAQYLYQTGLANDGLIACTQPRKIAATSLATHVAKEMGTSVGQLVGYKVGMQSKKTDVTKIMYMTDHVLLNECLKDKKLSSFSCIIIDEAHERSIYTDLLLGMIKKCLADRPDLRVIITSATIDPEVFVRYFGDCPVLSVSGRVFPVEVEWKGSNLDLEPFGNYEDEAVIKAVQVHQTEPDGDILVFLTSPLEAERCCDKFRDCMEGTQENFVCFQLHGRLQADEQQKVFEPLAAGKRKIVFATNSAETSVTIPGIKYVIDTGLAKEMQFDVNRKINTLAVKMVTKSSADQRKGRAGRTGPGKCFRLYTEDDYEEMTANAVPEILKVHIGHALLKLMELGIDPMEFDFVMSPSTDAMEAAIVSLQNIGAVEEKKITDMGKWIAKLPLDPKYGAFVHRAIDEGVGLEAIIIAATSGVGSLFYRAGTNEEKELADKHKVKFCHVGGDHMTMLNVFKVWHMVPEKQKGKWCVDNSINGKAMKGARQTVNEVLHVLNKDMKTDIRFTFGHEDDVKKVLKNLLVRTLKDNLSCYLGHSKAGYHVLNKDQRVEIHPSSALMSLGSQQDWIVFDQVMRTARDFAMNVTPVSKEDILDAIKCGWLIVDVDEAIRKRVVLISSEFCGSQVFREFVGPRYSNLRKLQLELTAKYPNSITILDANRDFNELKIFSNEKNKSALQHELRNVLNPIKDRFQAEESEERIGSKPIDVSVRAMIGAGGCTHSLYMPEEYRMVKIFGAVNVVPDLTKEDVVERFSKYGEIQECKQYNLKHKSSLWGHVMYFKTKAAVKAVNETKGNPDLYAVPNVRKALELEGFKTKIQWCRRSSRGFGFVEFTEVDNKLRATMLQNLLVGGSNSRVKVARNSENSVHVSGFNNLVTEDVLRHSVAEALNIDPKVDIKKVNIVREKVSATSSEDVATYQRRLLHKIEEYATADSFHLEILHPRDKDIQFIGFCRFNNPEEGHRACIEINNGYQMNGQRVSMKANLNCSIYIHKRIFDKSGKEVEACVRKMEDENKPVRPKWKQLKNENVIVELHAENAEALAEARGAIQDIIRGEVIECEGIQMAKSLFCRNGRTEMQKIMNKTETLIVMDDREMTISIHGLATDRQRASKQISDYINELAQENVKEIELKGSEKPPGVMKSLLQQFGIDLDGIRMKTGLAAVRLDHRFHRLRLVGSDESIAQTVTLVNGVIETLSGHTVNEDDNPDCVTCFTPIERNDIYRLECCGHAYCKDCVRLQLESNIASKDFPIVCGQENCNVAFCWKDIFGLSRHGFVALAKLATSSVSAFVSQHKKEFHYCITPDCPVVYRITEKGVPFLCPECDMKICTACHIQYHDGLSCAMYKSMKRDDGGLMVWMLKDKENRKLCPSCATPIQKMGGCQHMTCTGCKQHICWICLAYFDSSASCYGHLSDNHGSFV